MELRAEVDIGRPVSEVWSFFMDLSNLPRWDRGVATLEVTSDTGGISTTFDTIGHNGRRMSIEVTHLEENYRHKAVTRSGEFNWGEWDMTLVPSGTGTTVICLCRFSLRRRFVLLAPALRLLGGRGVRRDLAALKRVIEQDAAPGGIISMRRPDTRRVLRTNLSRTRGAAGETPLRQAIRSSSSRSSRLSSTSAFSNEQARGRRSTRLMRWTSCESLTRVAASAP